MAIKQMEQEFPTRMLPEEKAMLVDVLETFYPFAMKVEKEGLVFMDITGEKSAPIPVPEGVEVVGVVLAWISPESICSVEVSSDKWVSAMGIDMRVPQLEGIKSKIFESFPHTPSYLGGDGSDMIRRVSTVFRSGDLPLRRDRNGIWTSSGLRLEGTEEIPSKEIFQVEDLETGAVLVMESVD